MPAILHIVALRFKEEFTEEQIARHFIEEVNLKVRMPELVDDFTWRRNISLADRRDVNGGCQWVVVARLRSDDPAKLAEYLSHPEHKEVGRLQNPMLEGRFVVDIVVD